MRINKISQNTKPSFGVNVSKELKKGLYENLIYMKDYQGMSEEKVLQYADRVNDKFREMKEWDSDKNYQFLYRSGIGIRFHVTQKEFIDDYKKAGIISDKQIESAKNEFKKEKKNKDEEKSFFPKHKTGWIAIPPKYTISVSNMDGIGWRGYAISTQTANVDGEMVKEEPGKNFVEGFLGITKEKYFAKRKASIDNFFKKYIGDGNNISGEQALNRAGNMGKDSGKIFKKMFFSKFPEKKEEVTPEMLKLTEIKEKTLTLADEEIRFGV